MAKQHLKDKTVKGVAWSAVEKFSGHGIQFLVTLVIARILTPKDFGLVGMLAVFISISQALVDGGFSSALIRKQDRTQADNCTAFYFNITISVVLYGILFLIAPWVADFYNEPQLKVLMQVLCLIVIVNSFGAVQRALYTANLNFKTQAKASAIAAFLSGAVGIVMAYQGYGVWSLVGQQLLNAIFCVGAYWWYSNWRPHLVFSWKSFRQLFAFGSNLMLSTLINAIYGNLYQIVIGKIFSASSLGFFSQAKHITHLPSMNVTAILDRVAYPMLSTIQDDDSRLEKTYRMYIRISAFCVFPLMCGLGAVARPLVELVLGEKWLYTSTLMIPMCFSLMWYPVHAINLDLLKVKGRSDLFLKLEIIKKIIGIVILAISIPFGLLFMCWMHIVSSIVSLIINTYYTGKLINVGFFLQMRDLLPTLTLSLLMFGLVIFLSHIIYIPVLQLVCGGIMGGLFYIGTAYLLKFKELVYIKNLVNHRKHRKI